MGTSQSAWPCWMVKLNELFSCTLLAAQVSMPHCLRASPRCGPEAFELLPSFPSPTGDLRNLMLLGFGHARSQQFFSADLEFRPIIYMPNALSALWCITEVLTCWTIHFYCHIFKAKKVQRESEDIRKNAFFCGGKYWKSSWLFYLFFFMLYLNWFLYLWSSTLLQKRSPRELEHNC